MLTRSILGNLRADRACASMARRRADYGGRVSTPRHLPAVPFLPLPDIAQELGVIITKVHQMVRDRTIIAVRVDGVWQVPADFLADGEVVRGLPGTITLLTDAGYDDTEIIDWLFAEDQDAAQRGEATSAMALLRAGGVREVHRRAQISGF